tara:strand:+ start:312 stop:476 length:165 start_codon:yes stop_codon:yes gene_type:complete
MTLIGLLFGVSLFFCFQQVWLVFWSPASFQWRSAAFLLRYLPYCLFGGLKVWGK